MGICCQSQLQAKLDPYKSLSVKTNFLWEKASSLPLELTSHSAGAKEQYVNDKQDWHKEGNTNYSFSIKY